MEPFKNRCRILKGTLIEPLGSFKGTFQGSFGGSVLAVTGLGFSVKGSRIYAALWFSLGAFAFTLSF